MSATYWAQGYPPQTTTGAPMAAHNHEIRTEQQRRRLSPRTVVIFSALCLTVFAIICGSVLWDMRRSEEALARKSMENLAAGLDAEIGRNIEIYDLSLRHAAARFFDPELDRVSAAARRLMLFDHSATAEHFGAIEVVDQSGRVVLESSEGQPRPDGRGDEDYFQVHRDSADAGLFIGRPRLHRGSYAVVLSRRISGRDGGFLGIVSGSIRFSYFHALFGRLQLAPRDTITVLRRDGLVIMRTPFDLDHIGKDLSTVPSARTVLTEPAGAFTGVSPIDRISRFYLWRDNGHPLRVLVARSWDDILSIWRREVLRIGAIMLALIGLVAAATVVLAREIGRRTLAEDRLEQLATTDALTGLDNRRKLDLVLAREWRRALRTQTPLALLMIDADHFKAFNDMLGHRAGDQVLMTVAASITASARRAGDCAARYGGEEFAVLLPGLPGEQALAVAETIRRRVEAECAENWGTTVSIGVASVVPTGNLIPDRLVEAADRALYEAKARGRNQCCVAPQPGIRRVA
jgi:diguanylate cyclase (GGDEF)-like protein